MANERSTPERKDRPAEGRNPHGKASPRKASEQEKPEQERPPTPDELAGESVEDLEQPPQAEGTRDSEEEGR